MDQFKLDLYEDEVYVFTPKGEIKKFPKGATVLDFAYSIHSNVGNTCVGGKINGKNVSIREILQSGNTVEILTQASQKPNASWLTFIRTNRAKSKIRLALKETTIKDGLYAKEMLERRFKNRKLEYEESVMNHLIKKMGFKEISDFYKQIADQKLEANSVIEKYIEVRDHLQNPTATRPVQSAESYSYENPEEEYIKHNEDIL